MKSNTRVNDFCWNILRREFASAISKAILLVRFDGQTAKTLISNAIKRSPDENQSEEDKSPNCRHSVPNIFNCVEKFVEHSEIEQQTKLNIEEEKSKSFNAGTI